MAHYSINLPGNMRGEVRQGKVFKNKAGLFKQWPWIKVRTMARTGYIVTVSDLNDNRRNEYHLIRSEEGDWPSESDHELNLAIKKDRKWQTIEENKITLAIKKAIDEYEKKQ